MPENLVADHTDRSPTIFDQLLKPVEKLVRKQDRDDSG